MSVQLKVALPPEGMTARRLLMNFLAELSLCQDLELSLEPDHAIIEAPSADVIEEYVNYTLQVAGQVLEDSLEEHRLVDMPINTNDRRWVFEKLGIQVPRGSKFCRVISGILKRAQLPWDELARDLPVVEEKASVIQLGDGVRGDLLSLPQPFLYERYQAKYEFLRGRSGDEIKFKATRAWLYVLFTGFAFGYCGNHITGKSGELVIAVVPEPTLSQVLADEGARSLIIRDGLLPTVRRLGLPPRPAIAYMLYVACEVIKALGPQAMDLELLYRIPTALLEMDRVSSAATAQAFTLIERISMDFAPLLRELARLDTELIEWIQRKCRKAIVGREGATSYYSDYVRLSIAIFQALSGALDPADLCYYALRVVAEHEAERLDLAARLRKLRSEGWLVSKLLRSLRGVL